MADHPINECVERAGPFINLGHRIFQKWTCQHCGDRQMMEKPNTFFRSGTCGKCGEVSIIEKCNYLLELRGRA